MLMGITKNIGKTYKTKTIIVVMLLKSIASSCTDAKTTIYSISQEKTHYGLGEWFLGQANAI